MFGPEQLQRLQQSIEGVRQLCSHTSFKGIVAKL